SVEYDGGLVRAECGHGRICRPASHGSQSPSRLYDAERPSAALAQRGGQYRRPTADRRRVESRDREEGRGADRTGRLVRFCPLVSFAAVRRHEEAYGPCATAGRRPGDLADGRAVRGARCAITAASAERAALAVQEVLQDRAVRD